MAGTPRRFELFAFTGSSENMPSSSDEAASNVLPCNAKHFGQFPVPDSGVVKHLGSINIKRRANVFALMRGVVDDRQVFDSVVGLDSVDMVDMLGAEQLASDVLLHNPPVFIDLFPFNADHPVSGSVEAIDEISFRMTGVATKDPFLLGPNGGSKFFESFPASRADTGNAHVCNIPYKPFGRLAKMRLHRPSVAC
jgi:hypothetical protein